MLICRKVFECLLSGLKMHQKYSRWILLLQRQSRHEWCVQSLKAGIFLDVPSPSSYLLKNTKKGPDHNPSMQEEGHLRDRKGDVGKNTHSCLPQGKWSAGGLSCFSLQEPLEVVWRRDSVMKSLGNYCSFSRGGLVVSLQYRHYQTSLAALKNT